MWAIDLTHTAHTGAQTGIQQVCRRLNSIFEEQGIGTPVIYDRYAGNWRTPDHREIAMLKGEGNGPAGKRSAKWTMLQKIRGTLKKAGNSVPEIHPVKGLFCPEILGRRRINILYENQFSGSLKKVALFHDAIAMKFPGWCPIKTVQDFPDYLNCLARFDHVACISRTSEADLLEQWDKLGVEPAPTSVIPLGTPRNAPGTISSNPGSRALVVCIGTMEERKNHRELLSAAEDLWTKGLEFDLEIAGMLNSNTGRSTLILYHRLKKMGRPVNWLGPVSDEVVQDLYSRADILAYPSLYEGFGLPVLEALQNGVPVLTTSFGALGELTEAGGGCLVCDGTRDGICKCLERFLTDNQTRMRLKEEAKNRKVATMQTTAQLLTGLFNEISPG